MRLVVLVSLLLSSAALFTGCESTQSKSARLAKNGKGALQEHGLTVSHRNPDVKVVSTDAIQDQNGTAVVVDLRNTGKKALATVPVAINVKDRSGKSIFKNDAPGLEPSLTQAALLLPGKDLVWVNDQVNAAGKPKKVEAKVGKEKRDLSSSPPRLSIEQSNVTVDPVDGPEATGFIANGSGVEQQKLVIFAVARAGGKIVAAGRGQVNRLKAHAKARFRVFFIGDPRRGRLTYSVPPTVLG